MNESTAKPFALTLENREKAILTGVTDVERFDESEVVLHTHGGRLTLTGANLHVSSLQLEEGRLLVDGVIDGASYDNVPLRGGLLKKGGFFRRALG